MPTGPGVLMWLGMIPILHCPGVTTPGQLAPKSFPPATATKSTARVMSRTGIPTVMQTVSAMPATADSMITSATHAGGTNTPDTYAAGDATASPTVAKPGTRVMSHTTLPGH